MSSKTSIFIRDLRLTMTIGVYAHEKVMSQPVVVNVVADVTPPQGGWADSYANVVCYGKIADGIRAIAAKGHIHLAETLAEDIAALCLATDGVESVSVRVEKTGIMPDAAGVGVEIRRVR